MSSSTFLFKSFSAWAICSYLDCFSGFGWENSNSLGFLLQYFFLILDSFFYGNLGFGLVFFWILSRICFFLRMSRPSFVDLFKPFSIMSKTETRLYVDSSELSKMVVWLRFGVWMIILLLEFHCSLNLLEVICPLIWSVVSACLCPFFQWRFVGCQPGASGEAGLWRAQRPCPRGRYLVMWQSVLLVVACLLPILDARVLNTFPK